MPEEVNAPSEPPASCARIHQRLDAAENSRNHIDGPHVPNKSTKGWIVVKGGDLFGLPE